MHACMHCAVTVVKLAGVCLCSAMQWGVFLFFAACMVVMTVYIAFCLPETKGIPVERIMDAWAM